MFFSKKKVLTRVMRNFSTPYLKDPFLQKQLEEEGYAILPQVLSDDEINEAVIQFNRLKAMEGYEVNTIFRSTGNFKSFELQKTVFSFIHQYMTKIGDRFINFEHCEIGKGGAFFIKPVSTESQLEPHQDSTVIDETVSYATFVWMPLSDITPENGPLYVLPKSHLWGNFYRSQHIPWAFRKIYKELWKYMIPLYVKKGDIIFFDSSIIHGSSINTSDEFRVVVCGALLPKHHQKVDYTLNRFRKTVDQFLIDDDYWLKGGTKSSLKLYPSNTLKYDFPNPVTLTDIKSLLEH